MKLSIKSYKIEKTKKYIKTNNLFFIVNGANRNSLDWLLAEQGLKIVGFCCYKVLNKTTIKALDNSVYNKINPIIKGSTFFVKPQQHKPFLKQTILNAFNPLLFELLIFKFNNRIHSLNYLKNAYSLDYQETKLLWYQFNLTCIKACCKFSK